MFSGQMKKKACNLIAHAAANLDLHEIVVERSKKMFAEFRDVREHVHQFEAIVAGCILSAFLDTGNEVLRAQAKKTHLQTFGRNEKIASNKPVDEKMLHPFTCTFCKMKFNAQRGLQFHHCDLKPEDKSASHKRKSDMDLLPIDAPDAMLPSVKFIDGKRYLQCPLCAKTLLRKEEMKSHIERHKKQSKKRKEHIADKDVDATRTGTDNVMVSANPSVQISTHDGVLFRGRGRREWIRQLDKQHGKNA